MSKLGSISDCKRIPGFWSNRDIYVNTTSIPVWIRDKGIKDVIEHITSRQKEFLHQYIDIVAKKTKEEFVRRGVIDRHDLWKMYSLKAALFNKRMVDIGIKKSGGFGKYEVFEEEYKNRPNEVELLFLDVYHKALDENKESDVIGANFGNRIDHPACLYRINWHYFLKERYSLDQLIFFLVELRGYQVTKNWTLNNGNNLFSHPAFTIKGLVNEPFIIDEFKNNKRLAKMAINAIASAAGWALCCFVKENWLLLNIKHTNLKPSIHLYEEYWKNELSGYFVFEKIETRRLYFRMLQTSTAQSMDDLSVDFCREYETSKTAMNGAGVFNYIAPIHRYEKDNSGINPFPIGYINRRRSISTKTPTEKLTHPDYYEASGYLEWAKAINLYYELVPQAIKAKRSMIYKLVNWAIANEFQTPWTIKPINLINPLNVPDKNTFYQHLKSSSSSTNTASSNWSSSARFMKIAVNALKPLPEYDRIISGNPFSGLKNPFVQSKGGFGLRKTLRNPIPSEHLDAMLAILLSTDTHGKLTFEWAKSIFKADRAERYNHVSNCYECVWHPARAICLALLLLIPIRGKQARWLDQGLMDSDTWDIENDKWTRNTHPLKDYQYSDGKYHPQRYGRNSGILQPAEAMFHTGGEQPLAYL